MHWDLGSHKSVEKLGNGNYVFFCIFIYLFFFNIKETPRIYLFFPTVTSSRGKKKKIWVPPLRRDFCVFEFFNCMRTFHGFDDEVKPRKLQINKKKIIELDYLCFSQKQEIG